MLLAIDIGNSNISIGCLREDEILFEVRIATDRARTSDQYGVEIQNMLEANGVHREDIHDSIISSVVPPVFNSVWAGVYKMTGRRPLVVEADMDTGLEICLDMPSQVGADRIVMAVAALERYSAPLILIDMGTISLGRPGKVVATNTADCMRSGIMYGNACMLDGMIDRMEEELGHGATLVATGGLAPFITPLCRHEIILEPELLLRGLNALYKRNRDREPT